MSTSSIGNPRSPGDPLRAEIEVALRDELRRRRASTLRWSLVGVGVAVALVSVVLVGGTTPKSCTVRAPKKP